MRQEEATTEILVSFTACFSLCCVGQQQQLININQTELMPKKYHSLNLRSWWWNQAEMWERRAEKSQKVKKCKVRHSSDCQLSWELWLQQHTHTHSHSFACTLDVSSLYTHWLYYYHSVLSPPPPWYSCLGMFEWVNGIFDIFLKQQSLTNYQSLKATM